MLQGIEYEPKSNSSKVSCQLRRTDSLSERVKGTSQLGSQDCRLINADPALVGILAIQRHSLKFLRSGSQAFFPSAHDRETSSDNGPPASPGRHTMTIGTRLLVRCPQSPPKVRRKPVQTSRVAVRLHRHRKHVGSRRAQDTFCRSHRLCWGILSAVESFSLAMGVWAK